MNLVDGACSSPSKFEQGNGQFPVCGWLSIKHSHLEGFRIAMFACERVSRCMPKHGKARCQVTNGSIAKASAVDNQRRQEEAWGKGVLGRARFESDSEWVVYHSTFTMRWSYDPKSFVNKTRSNNLDGGCWRKTRFGFCTSRCALNQSTRHP